MWDKLNKKPSGTDEKLLGKRKLRGNWDWVREPEVRFSEESSKGQSGDEKEGSL